ncbi:MAG: COG4705 family protein [Acetobacteraceae bacterium]
MSLLQTRDATGILTREILNKVPEITITFWIIKILATTVGETAADFLNVTLGLGLSVTSYVMAAVFLVSLLIQISYRKYVPWAYWLTVVLISVVGTLVSDTLVDKYGVSLQTTTIAFSIALVGTFILWYRSENTLSIHSIHTRKRELFYWAAILFTFALGTAAGDLAAERLHLGYGPAALMFAGAIALVTLCYYAFRANAIVAFWIAYILTRPLGASCGDLLAQPVASGGLGLGRTLTSAIFLAAILCLVLCLTFRERWRNSRAPRYAHASESGEA